MIYRKIDSLTSLRFIAVAMIVVHHSRGVLWLTNDDLRHFALDQAVSFFFVLSGFVLTHVYPRLNKPSFVGQFYIMRFARIWPNHVAAFIFGVLIFLPWSLYSIREPKNAVIAIANILLVQGWYPAKEVFFSFNAVTWALSAEVFFYLCFPLLIKDFENKWLRNLLFSFLIMIGVITFCNIAKLPYSETVPSSAISSTGLVYINPLCRLFEFVTGMCIAVLWKNYDRQIKLTKLTGTLLEATAMCIVISTVYFSISVADNLTHLVGPAGSEYLSHAGSTLSFALLIFIMALEKGQISRVLCLKAPAALGETSFSIFLFHQLILRYYSVYSRYFSAVPKPLLYALFWVFTLVISFLALMFIERPCRRLIGGLTWLNSSGHFEKRNKT
jgi:peptidoglycan/LPS O-acetylase OafA/YrhL